jgi:threonine synthase
MDIAKASNFERFVFDLADRDPTKVRALWAEVERDGGFDLSGTPLEERLRESAFVSDRSTHADRIATIQAVADNYRMVIDPHTADGIKVGLEQREKGIPLICIETALPAKFGATIREALGRQAARPAAYIGIEERPQRYAVLPPEVAAVKSYIAERAVG